MIRSLCKATTGCAVALMLISVSTSVQGFTGMYSTLMRGGQPTQLTGKLVCTECSVTEAHKAQPHKYGNHLYQLQLGQNQAVMEVLETNHFTWLNHLTMPHIRVRGEENILLPLTSQDNVRKDVTISGYLLDAQTLAVQEITVHQ